MTSDPVPLHPPDDEAVLRARARAYARSPEPARDGAERVAVIEFSLAHERYALELAKVGGVYPLEDLTPLLGSPAFVPGIVNLHGRVIPVFDLRRFFDLPEQGLVDLHQVILLREAETELGLLADTVRGVRTLSRQALQTNLPTLSGIRADYLKGITPDLVVLLDAARLLADPRILVNDEVE